MLIQLAIIQLSLALCFAVVTFFFERENSQGQFRNMIDSLWYALITMYTIGYGDQVFVTKKVLLQQQCHKRYPKHFWVAVPGQHVQSWACLIWRFHYL